MKRTNDFVALLLCAGALAAAPTPAAETGSATAKGAELFPDPVVAKGKGVEVKRSQVDDKAIHFKAQMAARNQVVPPEQVALLQQRILDSLIQIQLLKAKATDAEKADARKIAEKQLTDEKARLGSEDSFNLQLKAMGLTREGVLAEASDNEMAKIVLARELKVNVTEADIKKFYDENLAKFEQPEMVRASHILLGTMEADGKTELPADKKAAKRKLAEDLLKRARAGDDFAKLAKDYSDDPGSKDRGGEYKFPRGRMVREFERAAFALKTNEVSDIVTTQFGYHIIKLQERIPARQAHLDDEVTFDQTGTIIVKPSGPLVADEANMRFVKLSTVITNELTSQQLQKQVPGYMASLKTEAGVEILDPDLKPKEASDLGLPAGHPPTGASKKSDLPPGQTPPDAKKPDSK